MAWGQTAARAARIAAVSLGIAAAAPAAAHADFATFGSDLKANADWREAHGADAFFWLTKLANGTDPKVPLRGQIVQIRLKGMAIPNADPAHPPLTEIHFQTMAINPDGSPSPQVSSGPVQIPDSGDPNQITTYDLRAQNFCTEKGYFIDFTDEGGFDPIYYPNGVPYQVFGHVAGSATRQWVVTGSSSASDVTNNGQELLMQVTVASGADASPLCPGGTSPDGGHLPGQSSGGTTGGGGTSGGGTPPSSGSGTPTVLPKAIVVRRTPRVDAKRRNVRLTLRCTGTKQCKGRTALKVTRRIGARKRTLGFAFGTFTLAPGQTKTVSAKLTAFGRKLARQSSRIKGVTVTAFTYTSAGGRSSTRTFTVRR